MQLAIVVYPGMTALDAIGPYEVLNGLKDRELRFVWKDLALALLADIDGEDAARAVQLMLEYDPQPPFDCGHRSKADAATVDRATKQLAWAAANPRTALSIPKVLFRRWWQGARGR